MDKKQILEMLENSSLTEEKKQEALNILNGSEGETVDVDTAKKNRGDY